MLETYKFMVFYDLLQKWYKDKELAKLQDYEDIFDFIKKIIQDYDKSDYAKDYSQGELTCILDYFKNKYGG
tara:strand:- start:72 stop:284 length:213 start_codon:yes stop_codon:yes gene_type:complete